MALPFELDKPYEFYGVDNECFKLGDQALKALEDGDGYRSYLNGVEKIGKEGLIFFRAPIDTVKIVELSDSKDDGFLGYAAVSTTDGHEWLRFGDGNYGDWYPYFVFRYSPRAP